MALRLLDLAVVLAAAALLARAVWTPLGSSPRAQLALVSAPLALAMAGATYLCWLAVGGGASSVWVLWSIDLGVLVVAWLVSRRRSATSVALDTGTAVEPGIRYLIYAVTAAVLAAGIISFLVTLRASPHGEWDAWAIWNIRARFLYRDPDWTRAVEPGTVHVDYPLLQPLIIARGWAFAGTDTTLVPRALVFASALLALAWLFFSVRKLRGAVAACLALVAVLNIRPGTYSMPRMLAEASTQLAEILLMFFMLASACAIVLALSAGERQGRRIVLAGVLAGCAAWTKNEGQLFALSLLIALSVMTWRDAGMRTAARAAGSYLAGLAPLTAALWVVKSVGEASSEFFTRSPTAMLRDIADIERHGLILQATLRFLTDWRNLPLLFFLAVLALFAGLTTRRHYRVATATIAVTVALMTAGFYTIYLITPSPLNWHLATSLDRLFMQIWPMLILMFFVAVRTPAEVMADLAMSRASEREA